jgi:enoyl-CoA hydratase
MTESAGAVHYALDADGIATITIDNQAHRNAMTYPMIEQMFAGLRSAAEDDSCGAVILTGAGDAFCAGIDLRFLASLAPEQRGIRVPVTDGAWRWNIVACPKPVIAAIDGAAVGMGAEWTSHCDIRIATDRARFAWNFVQRGLVPDTGAGTWLLPRQIGLQAALDLLYSGAWLSAPDALAMGYLKAVVSPEDLINEARTTARRYLGGSPQAQGTLKHLVYDGLGRSIAEHQRVSRKELLRSFHSRDHAEGLAAFLEHRAPRFRPAGHDHG